MNMAPGVHYAYTKAGEVLTVRVHGELDPVAEYVMLVGLDGETVFSGTLDALIAKLSKEDEHEA